MSVFIIAEVGSVHDGSFGNAGRLIDAAAEAGADAVKFQPHIPQAETVRDAPSPPYFTGEPRFDYFARTGFAPLQWRMLKERAEAAGLVFLSSPFSTEAVELLEELGVQRYKVPSGEVTNLPLLAAIAATSKPVLLSSGMSSWEEIDDAVATLRGADGPHDGGPRADEDWLTVLQCTSEYPCPYERVGLNVMKEMRQRYRCPVGLSDHTLTPFAAYAAVTLGATVIEKHFTFSRRMYGSDAAHSLEPGEFAEMVRGIRAVEAIMAGEVDKGDHSRYREMKDIFEKSVVTLATVPRGEVLTSDLVGVKKPGTGIPARRYREVLGRRATRNLAADQVLREHDVDWVEQRAAR